MTDRIILEDPALIQLARELAELIGQDLPTSVRLALDRCIETEVRLKRVHELVKEFNAHRTGEASSDHSWLYDENGLPA